MSRGLKILIDARFLGRNPNSGVEEYARQMITHLAQAAPENEYQIIKNRFFGVPNKIFRLNPLPIDRLLAADLIYSPHINFLRHSAKTPRILTIHDLSFLHFPHFFSFRDRFWHWTQRIKTQAQKAALIITDSQFSKNDIAETLKIPEEKIRVVYPGITREPSPGAGFGEEQKLKPYILYLGRLEPRKNVLAVIKAFHILKANGNFSELRLILAGRPGWRHQETLVEIQRSPYRRQIELRGMVTVIDKFSLYTSAEAFIYPTFFEGFGFPPLEAQACRCPVVASNRASLSEILGDSALLINPWLPDQIAAAVERILTNDDLRRELVRRGHANSQRFSWHQCAAHVLKFFSGLYSLPAPPPA